MASAKLIVSLLLLFAGYGVIFCQTDPGDASVLLYLREIWKNTPPNWADSDDPCSIPWDGITCKNSRVTLIKLASMGLEGKLVPEIGQLTELHCLDLSFNSNMTGPIPSSIGNMKMLKMLCLCAADLGGTIPPEIVNLHKLDFLALNANNLTGEIPPNIGRLTNLEWLDLGNNRLTGTLPVSSGGNLGLDNLLLAKHIHLGQNQLSGTIPESLFHPRMNLSTLLLEGNSFTGPIPASLGNLPNLQILRLDRNALTGTVPSNITNSTQLRDLNLARNGLTGDLPDLIRLTALNCVDLSFNVFTSSLVPNWLYRLPSLSVALMQYAGLTGEFPTDIFNTSNLKQLFLGNNKINGTADFGMVDNSPLTVLDLQSNIITRIQNEPSGGRTAVILHGNPICNSASREKVFCRLADPEGYSTVRNCSNQCPAGETNRPVDCTCGHPYTGTTIFHSPSFQDLTNASRFQKLEKAMKEDLGLGDNCVSLKNPVIDENGYLRVDVELFPTDSGLFNRSRILWLGFLLGSQELIPDREWGPYVFLGKPYNFNHRKERTFSTGVVAGIAAASIALLIGLLVLGIYAVREKRKADRANRAANPFAHWETDDQEAGSAPQLNGVHFFSLSEVNIFTDDFSPKNKIGVGGYGEVYQGKLQNGQLVAIKRAKKGSLQGALEFKTEIELLSRVHHMNLVRLVGFCYEKGEQMLIYEYVPNGTLAEALSEKIGLQLGWIDRLRIALGSARGLAYLHDLADPPIIHRDVKTANILLDDHLTAKVADFGLSRVVAETDAYSPTEIKGTLGYLDPEYFETQQLTDKSDVYSLGIVMLELLTGKKAIEKAKFIVHQVKLAIQTSSDLKEIVDPVIRNAPVLVGLEKFVDLAMQCVERCSIDRPTMRDIVKEIEAILDAGGLDSRSTSVASSTRYSKTAGGRGRYSDSISSLEMSSNGFHSSAAGYLLQADVEPK